METSSETPLVRIGEALDGRAMEKRHPASTVASAPRKTSGIAVGNDKRNGWARRAADERRVNCRAVRYLEGADRYSTVCPCEFRVEVPVCRLRQPAWKRPATSVVVSGA